MSTSQEFVTEKESSNEQQDKVGACGGQDFCVNAREFRTADLAVPFIAAHHVPRRQRISGTDDTVAVCPWAEHLRQHERMTLADRDSGVFGPCGIRRWRPRGNTPAHSTKSCTGCMKHQRLS